ncbi:hypothetical protein F5Y13DRAFT_191878 [Hypoxylon sp. FL1857]|nr:hypothetical protein F5Y13DRAFT_191878 [Hypoxylon sp. FL1857]
MKITTIQAAIGSAILLLNAQPCAATAQHRHHHLHKKHSHSHVHTQIQQDAYNPKYSDRNSSALVSRDGGKTCKFPTDKGLFAVTPDGMNGGWAMAPDQECGAGTWCPFACPSGQVMAQWKPGTSYKYPESTYGGVYCNDDGEIEVPFKNKPWCVDGTGTVEAVNKAGKVVSFCQTCLPGYEDMIIPTDVQDTATLSVPDMTYWASTAAHYYINAPGVDSSQGCHWGDESKPIGNWSPYVAGANTVGDGSTYVKLGINPVWQASSLYNTKPNFGLRVECPDGNCNGAKCSVDGDGVKSDNKASGAGGSDFCVVTVPKGGKANIVVYTLDGSGGDDDSSSSSSSSPSSTEASSTSSTPTSSSVASTTSSSSKSSSTSSSSAATSSSAISRTSSSGHSPSSTQSTSASATPFLGGVFQENGTVSTTFSWVSPSSTAGPVPASTGGDESTSSDTNKNEGAGQRQGGAAIAGLIVAFVAASYLL